MQFDQVRTVHKFVSPFDPCPPKLVDTFIIPPNQFIGFQPPNLPQFSPSEALRHGTLWPLMYSHYEPGLG